MVVRTPVDEAVLNQEGDPRAQTFGRKAPIRWRTGRLSHLVVLVGDDLQGNQQVSVSLGTAPDIKLGKAHSEP